MLIYTSENSADDVQLGLQIVNVVLQIQGAVVESSSFIGLLKSGLQIRVQIGAATGLIKKIKNIRKIELFYIRWLLRTRCARMM